MSDDSTRKLGRYQLLGSLATGGMAEIHLARQTGIKGFEKLVVVKTILKHLAKQESFLEMFFDEARIAAQLNHPNIIQIFDLGQEGDDYFMAMEYLEGEDLGYLIRKTLKAGKIMPPQIACKIVIEICKALAYAHGFHDVEGRPLKIVHRDISPHNIVVLFSGPVKLVDFGIAKAESKIHQTRTGTLKGKLSYMSPEQARSLELDSRSDIFAVGIVLWELLCMRRLFKRDTAMAVLSTIVNDPIPSIREVRPGLSKSLDAIVARCLDKDPELRYQNAGELAKALGDEIRNFPEDQPYEDVAAFVGDVLGDRAKTKRKMIEKIRLQDADSVSLGGLKEQTDRPLTNSKDNILANTRPNIWRIALLTALVFGLSGLATWWVLRGNAETGAALLVEAPTRQPAKLPTNPTEAPAKPTGTDANPTGAPAKPTGADANPTGAPAKPTGAGANPTGAPAKPTGADANPTGAPTKPNKTPANSTKAPAKPATRKTIAVKKAKPGLLRLDTDPWSEVFLGKKRLGMTPLLGLKLPVGKHTLTAVNAKLKIKKRIQITIKAGKTTSLFVEIDK